MRVYCIKIYIICISGTCYIILINKNTITLKLKPADFLNRKRRFFSLQYINIYIYINIYM